MTTGKVYLVGAGPGDSGLITVKGVVCLQQADVIIYDRLVNRELLAHVRPGCELIARGEHRSDQRELYGLMANVTGHEVTDKARSAINWEVLSRAGDSDGAGEPVRYRRAVVESGQEP